MKSFLPMTGALQGSLDLLLKALKVMDSWAWPQPRLTWSSCTHWWVLEVVARSLDPSWMQTLTLSNRTFNHKEFCKKISINT